MKIQRISRIISSRYKRVILLINASINFFKDLQAIRRQLHLNIDFPINGYYPFIFDKYNEGGNFIQHYFEQDLLIAQRIFHNNPGKHIDIGSRVDGFVAHVASFRQIEVLDIRPIERHISNVTFRQANLMQLPEELISYTDSISSLHVIEHFGLGRYGDPIDVNGHLKALNNIYLILKQGGKFYFSVPIGKQGIMFNAHRIFSLSYLVKMLEQLYKIDHFYLIDDVDKVHFDVDFHHPDAANSFGCRFGCAIFELTKI